MRCRTCGVVFASPRPTPAELEVFYSATYFEGSGGGSGLGYRDYRGLPELNAAYQWDRLSHELALEELEPKRLLDVGCATGAFLAAAKADGWQVEGVDLSSEAVAVARSEYGVDATVGDVTSPELDGCSFGLVTMWHVVEHVREVEAVMRRVASLVAPGGLLFMETPNWNSVGRVVRRSGWAQLKPPEHINFFTPTALASLVERVGLAPISVDTTYPSLANRAKVRGHGRPVRVAVAAIGAAACRLGRGGYLRVVARRAGAH